MVAPQVTIGFLTKFIIHNLNDLGYPHDLGNIHKISWLINWLISHGTMCVYIYMITKSYMYYYMHTNNIPNRTCFCNEIHPHRHSQRSIQGAKHMLRQGPRDQQKLRCAGAPWARRRRLRAVGWGCLQRGQLGHPLQFHGVSRFGKSSINCEECIIHCQYHDLSRSMSP